MHIHILGICGTFMGGLAALAVEAGHRVTGCDAGVYPPMSDQLRQLGIDLIEGYETGQLSLRPDVFVVGNVVSRRRDLNGVAKFPLMEAILDQRLPYTSGPQWLAEHILQGRHVLAVSGTHGKTTTTAMLAWILDHAGLEPGFLIGGVAQNFSASARLSAGEDRVALPFVIEADEYDTAFFDKRSKFIHYRPSTLVLNNLEIDHADIFSDLADIERQFTHLLRTVPSQGMVIAHGAVPSIERVIEQGLCSSLQRFGAAPDAWQASGPAHAFDVLLNGTCCARVAWDIQGRHNQENALAAIAAAAHIGVAPEQSAAALAQFKNVKRRMELRADLPWQGGRVEIYDDFAHHPSAIATTLEGMRAHLNADPTTQAARIIAVFEPRSNTMKLGTMKEQLAHSLKAAEVAICHTGGLGWDASEALVSLGERAVCADQIDTVISAVLAHLQPGDRIVCMSNGGFGGIHERLASAIQRDSRASG